MQLANQLERVKWDDFISRFNWKQGEHITLIGPTGSGKTTLINEILDKREYPLVLATKKVDSSLDQLKRKHKLKEVKRLIPGVHGRVMLRPEFPNVSATELKRRHREVFSEALMGAFRNGGYCVVNDEIRYLHEQLKLTNELELLWLQGRSLGVSMVAGTQRPRGIPLTAYNAASHLFLWRDNDKENLKRLSHISSAGVDPKQVQSDVANLPWHDVLYVNTRTGERLQSNTRG